MKKLNSKGFVLMETLIVAVFVVSIFTFLYSTMVPLTAYYESRNIQENNLGNLYKVYNIRNHIYKYDMERYDSIFQNNYGTYNCSLSSKSTICTNLLKELELKDGEYVIEYVKSYTASKSNLLNKYKDISYDTLYNYIKNYKNNNGDSIIILYDRMEDSVSSLYFPQSNVSVESTCFSYKLYPYSSDYLVFYNENTKEYDAYTLNTSKKETCKSYFMNKYGDKSDEHDGYELFCSGTGKMGGYTFRQKFFLMEEQNLMEEFRNSGFLTKLGKPYTTISSAAIAVTDYNINCGQAVVIPNTIAGHKVYAIGYKAFQNKGINTVTIPSNVKFIDDYAFANNNLSTITLGDNVAVVGINAFAGNRITKITLSANTNYLRSRCFPIETNNINEIVNPSGKTMNFGYALENDSSKCKMKTGTCSYLINDVKHNINIHS